MSDREDACQRHKPDGSIKRPFYETGRSGGLHFARVRASPTLAGRESSDSPQCLPASAIRSAPMEQLSQVPETLVRLPNCAEPIPLPNGWTQLADSTPLTLVGPEPDLRIALSVVPKTENLEDAAYGAWHEFDPEFRYPILQRAETPSAEGWDTVCQIIYNLPSSEGRSGVAILRMLGGDAYVCLIDASKAALSRRMAQISEILEAWKPAALQSVSLAARQQAKWGEEQSRQISEFILDGMEKLFIPGLAIGVVQNGEVVYAKGFGVRGLGHPEPVTPATQFMIGSSTKPLTTLLMARLIDKGTFTWSTPVRDLLPDFELADPEITRKLEMRHTACACTGMPRRDLDFVFRFKGISPEQRLAEMRTMRPTTGFGETFQYSNLLVAAGGYAAAHAFQPHTSLQVRLRTGDETFDLRAARDDELLAGAEARRQRRCSRASQH